MGGAAAVKIVLCEGGIKELPPTQHYGSKAATAELQTHEVQDLADRIDTLREATAGHPLRIHVTVEIGSKEKQIEPMVVEQINVILGEIKSGWKLD